MKWWGLLLLYLFISGVIIGILFLSFGVTKNVALIHINGEITDDSQIISDLEDANNNYFIKGIIIEINSPGGYVVESKRIAEEIKSIKKPTVCLLDDVAASGAYWIASSCDYIVADNFTIVGSIGASGSYLEFSGLMKKYGINYVRIVSGNEKDIGSPYKKPTQEEISQLQGMVNKIRDAFVREVAENRNLSYSFVDNISDGRIFLAEDAIKYKLVDKIGNIKDAENYIKRATGISKVEIKDYRHFDISKLFSKSLSQEILEYLLQNNLILH